jgi:putative acetyltransferase
MMIQLCEETPEEIEAVRAVNQAAFARIQEAGLVDKLRKNSRDLLSLVAIAEERVVGHILFSPVVISGTAGSVEGAGLGPVAVAPEFQRQGIGAALIKAGIRRLEQKKSPFIVVLGHPEYYPRFAFAPAMIRGIRCEWEVPEEAFMILVLDPVIMKNVQGTARYRPEFSDALSTSEQS